MKHHIRFRFQLVTDDKSGETFPKDGILGKFTHRSSAERALKNVQSFDKTENHNYWIENI